MRCGSYIGFYCVNPKCNPPPPWPTTTQQEKMKADLASWVERGQGAWAKQTYEPLHAYLIKAGWRRP